MIPLCMSARLEKHTRELGELPYCHIKIDLAAITIELFEKVEPFACLGYKGTDVDHTG